MTQALLAAYPDVFAAGSVLAGVPAGAWTGGNAYGWTTPDARTAAEWGDIVRKAGPMGFAGPWPRIQLWHGTSDTTLTYSQNFPSEVEQWTNVLMVSSGVKSSVKESGMQDTWERNTYANAANTVVLETNVAQGAPHDLSGRGLWNDVVRFFGLDKDAPGGGTGGSGGGGSAAGGATGGGSSAGSSSTTGGTGGASGAPGTAGSGVGGVVNGNGGSGNGNGSSVGGISNVGQAGSAGQASITGGGGGSNNSGGLGSVPMPANGSNGAAEDSGCSFHSGDARSPLALFGFSAIGLGMLLRRRRRAA
jgi:MYXO-CTERM domain-containing protein